MENIYEELSIVRTKQLFKTFVNGNITYFIMA